jgi:hypothetical protein
LVLKNQSQKNTVSAGWQQLHGQRAVLDLTSGPSLDKIGGTASMSEDSPPGSIEFERLEQELYALIEMEQATLLRSLALPVGYEKSQALAEYSNAVAAVSAVQRRRERFLLVNVQTRKPQAR